MTGPRPAQLAALTAAVVGAASQDPAPVGPFEHCTCCGHRLVGDHAGPVCPCASRDGEG